MSAASPSTYKLLPTLWPQKNIYEVLYDIAPTVGMIRKDTEFYEKQREIAVGTGAPQGLAPTYEDAKATRTASTAQEFDVTAVSYYGSFAILGRLMRIAKGGRKSVLVDPVKRDSKNLIWQWKRDFSRYLFGNGGGSLARLTSSSPAASQTGTLTNGPDIRAFDQNMTIQSASTDGTSGSVNNGYVTIASLGGTETAPTLTINETNWATGIAAVAGSDYLFRKGAFGAVMSGFDAWCPSHSGSPGTFKGVNRNVNPFKLAGIPVDASKLSMRNAISRAARKVFESGGKPDTYITSTANYESLTNELQSAGLLRYSQVPAAPIGKFNLGIKYDAVQVMGPAGPINVVADPDCPDAVSRMLMLETWTIASTGELVGWIEGAGPGGLRMEDATDSGEGRLVGDYQLICEAPGWNARVAH